MRDLTILDQATYGESPEFVTWEMVLTVTMDHDEPALGIVAGQTSTIRGVALQWWRWEGDGEKWEGGLDGIKERCSGLEDYQRDRLYDSSQGGIWRPEVESLNRRRGLGRSAFVHINPIISPWYRIS